MKDYRRVKRRKVDFNADVIDVMTDQPIGRICNLSESGILLLMHQRQNSGALFQLRFRLPDQKGAERVIEVGAHELWADETATSGPVLTGFRFIDIGTTDLAFVREWVDTLGSQYV